MAQQLGIRVDWQAIGPLPQGVDAQSPYSNELARSLDNTQLHLWQVPLTLDAEQHEHALRLLNDHQREKYLRRREPAQQQAYLAGRYYLFSLLSFYLALPIEQVKLGYSRLNKPRLLNAHIDLQFNYTDTRLDQSNVGLFAFCLNAEIGVDLEARARVARFDQIAKRRFTANELAYVTASVTTDIASHGDANSEAPTSESLQEQRAFDPERCLAIWTRKEAYGKATGKGINFAMNEQNLVSANEPYALNFTDGSNSDWRLNQIEIGKDLIACVVHSGHEKLNLKAFSLLSPQPVEPSA